MSDQAVVLLKLGMGRNPAVDVVVPFSLLPEACKYYHDKQQAISHIVGANLKSEAEDPTNAIYISDLRDDQTHFSLLLVRGDPGRRLPGFVNPALRTVRSVQADEAGFVPGASCHLVISKQEIAAGGDSGRYRAAIEKTRGIGRVLARDFLAQLLARFAEEHPERFTAEKKRRTKREKPEYIQYRPTLRFHPQPNASLKKDLEEGRIGGFKLTRGTTNFVSEADEPVVQRLDVQLHARIAPTDDISKVKRLITHVQENLKEIDFDALNLELVDDGGEKLSSTQAIPIDQFEDADMRYCKTIYVPDANASESECHSEFFEPLRKFAVNCLNNEAHWK